PSADTGEHRDVLLSIRSDIRHRISDNPRRRFEFPKDLAGLRVNGLQPTFHRAVKNNVAAGGMSASPGRQVFFDAPDLLPGRGIPRDELSSVTSGPRMANHDRADVRLARLILHFDAFVIHAQIVCRYVEEIRSR